MRQENLVFAVSLVSAYHSVDRFGMTISRAEIVWIVNLMAEKKELAWLDFLGTLSRPLPSFGPRTI